MRIPRFIYYPLFLALYHGIARKRPADQFIGEGPYMLRWWIFGSSREKTREGHPKPRRPFGFSFYFHCFLRSDDDRALHDHPWPFWSLNLFGGYKEHRDEDAPTYLFGDHVEWDWRGANNLVIRDERKHYDSGVRVIRQYHPGYMLRSKAADLHRIELNPQCYGGGPALCIGDISPHRVTDFPWMSNEQSVNAYYAWLKEQPAFTLVIAGRWQRDWGFQCEDGWKFWRDFDRDGGCGERTKPCERQWSKQIVYGHGPGFQTEIHATKEQRLLAAHNELLKLESQGVIRQKMPDQWEVVDALAFHAYLDSMPERQS